MKKLVIILLALCLLLASCESDVNVSETDISKVPENSEISDTSLPEQSEISEESEESVYIPVNLFEKTETVKEGKLEYNFNSSAAEFEFQNLVTFMETLYSTGNKFVYPTDEKYMLEGYTGRAADTFSFVYIDLETGCQMGYNTAAIYQTCSVIKPSLAVYMLKNGIDLSEEITITYYSGGSGVLKSTDVGKSFTAEYLMEIMITESDNTAYRHLLKKYDQQAFSDYLASIGNKNTNVGAPTWYKYGLISAPDLAVMMKDIYEYSTQDEKGAWVLECMQRATYNELITSVDGGIPVGHKYGEDNTIEPSLHDGAIYVGEHPYILVILSKSEVKETESYDKFKAITILVNEFHAAMHGGADIFTPESEVTR